MRLKKCQRCGAEFRCEGEGDCWCEKVQIHRVQVLEILERYTDCICPNCMKLYEAKQ